MWADSPFAGPRGSFLRPVPLPTHSPDDGGQVSVSVACDWLPWIRGALQQLLLQSTWQTTDPAALLQVQEWAFTLIDLFDDGACSSGPAFSCPYDFTTSGSGWQIWPVTGLGAYVSGHGYQTTLNPGLGIYQAVIQPDPLIPGELTSIEMFYDGGPGSPTAPDCACFYTVDMFNATHEFHHDVPHAGPGSTLWTGILPANQNLVLELNMGFQSNPAYITKVVVNGRSFTPPC